MGANGIYGLSGSGLDIESLVKVGMLNKQNQLDKMEQTETINTWKKEEWADIYSKLTTYKYSTLTDYKMQSNMSAMMATSSNGSVVTATANGAAAAMTHQVSVDQLATNAYVLTGDGEKIDRANTTLANSTALKDVIFKSTSSAGKGDDGKARYNVTLADGTTKTVGYDDVAISLEIADTMDNYGNMTYHKLEYTYGDLLDEGKSLYDLAGGVGKSGSGADVQGNYDAANDSFSIYNNAGGKNSILAFKANTAETVALINSLNLSSYDSSTNTLKPIGDITSEGTMATTKESNAISNTSRSTSVQDVLGLNVSLTKNGDTDTYNFLVKDSDGKTITELTGKTLDDIKNTNAMTFALKDGSQIDDGTGTGTLVDRKADIAFTYGELFDMDASGKVSGKANLSTIADKITAAGNTKFADDKAMGIAAVYDETKDSFSIVNSNPSAQVILEGTDKIGASMVDALNLGASKEATVLNINSSENIAQLFGFSGIASSVSGGKYKLTVKDAAGTDYSLSGAPTSYTGTAFKNKEITEAGSSSPAVVFTISDGNDSVDVNLTYGEIFNWTFNRNSSASPLTYNGNSIDAGNRTLSGTGNLSSLAEKIKAAVSGKLDIDVSYSSTDGLTLTNQSGKVEITSYKVEKIVDGSKVEEDYFGSKMSDVSSTYKGSLVSGGIKRVTKTSTSDTMKDMLGLSAKVTDKSKGPDDTDIYTIELTDSAGKKNTFTGSAADLAKEKVFAVNVGDTDKSAEVAISLGDIFDLGGSLNSSSSLSAKADSGMSSLVQKINDTAAANGIKTSASYDAATGKMKLNNSSGHAELTAVKDDAISKKLVSALDLKLDDATKASYVLAQGKDAQVTIDGKKYTLDKNSQTVAGVTYTFTGETPKGTTAGVTVNQDTDKIVDYVKKFVEDYNNLLDYMNDKLAEEKYRDYKPLTKKQEESMTETQISKWTEKAKSGLLYHDSTLQTIVSEMREALYTPVSSVDSAYNSAMAMGISSSTVKGHITLDEDKLRKALAADPDCVYQIFASDQDSSYISGTTDKNQITNSQKKLDYKGTGLANRLNNVMTKSITSVSNYAGTSKETNDQSYLGKLITNLQTKMSTFKTQMTAFENALYKKYDSMEVLLSNLGVQLNYITGYSN